MSDLVQRFGVARISPNSLLVSPFICLRIPIWDIEAHRTSPILPFHLGTYLT